MKNKINSFRDLNVYQDTYRLSLIIYKKILPKIPKEEQYDLKNQLRRSCKAIPALISEGFAKKHQPKAFQKYLDDAIGEANETTVHLDYCRDLFEITPKLIDKTIASYDKSSRKINRLKQVWNSFKYKPMSKN